jgi:hypothetical protein
MSRVIACLALLLALYHGAAAASLPSTLMGTWSQDATCPPDALTIVFTPGQMEIRQDSERRSLSEVSAKTASARDIELSTTRIIFVRQPNAAPPAVGDVLRFRRDGDLLRVVAVTMQGKLVDVPADSTIFHRCPR